MFPGRGRVILVPIVQEDTESFRTAPSWSLQTPLDTMLLSRQIRILSAQNRSPWKNADRGQMLLAVATPRLLVAVQMLVVVGVACRGEAAVVKEAAFPRTQVAV